MVRIAIVDDHGLFRDGVRSLLQGKRGIEVVAEGRSGEDAIRIARELEPNVMLLDIEMPGMSGLEATRRIVESGVRVRVLILSQHAEAPFPKRLLQSGALGFLSKGCEAAELITAIERVSSGRRYLQAELAQEIALGGHADGSSPFDSLSRRELDITLLLVRGLGPKAIGKQLTLSPKTVSTYKCRLMEKLGITSIAELTRMAILHGLIPAAEAGSLAHQNEPNGNTKKTRKRSAD